VPFSCEDGHRKRHVNASRLDLRRLERDGASTPCPTPHIWSPGKAALKTDAPAPWITLGLTISWKLCADVTGKGGRTCGGALFRQPRQPRQPRSPSVTPPRSPRPQRYTRGRRLEGTCRNAGSFFFVVDDRVAKELNLATKTVRSVALVAPGPTRGSHPIHPRRGRGGGDLERGGTAGPLYIYGSAARTWCRVGWPP
jgi:hypothetical protein